MFSGISRRLSRPFRGLPQDCDRSGRKSGRWCPEESDSSTLPAPDGAEAPDIIHAGALPHPNHAAAPEKSSFGGPDPGWRGHRPDLCQGMFASDDEKRLSAIHQKALEACHPPQSPSKPAPWLKPDILRWLQQLSQRSRVMCSARPATAIPPFTKHSRCRCDGAALSATTGPVPVGR